MNIKEAKEQIKNAMTAYFAKDETGLYELPPEMQRPVFLMGPPGIGKTAVMAQIASEMGVNLLSYSMTHHTRQSALGLPSIVRKVYDGKEYAVSEYTMSEIIASVYDVMETTGKREGILFLDEINCVSETLTPIMLQFLQYKIFGRHRVPDGWIVVTAGNPPEYNNSVREFDTVTWDRLKRIDIEPDFEAWKEYAVNVKVHPSILTYLSAKRENFYKIETTVSGKSFVTARGWEDLSRMILLYEKKDIKVDYNLVSQYLQNEKTARDFASYYDLWHKYKSDYQVESILAGAAPDKIKERAKKAKFDERLSLIGIIIGAVSEEINSVIGIKDSAKRLADAIKQFSIENSRPGSKPAEALDKVAAERRAQLEKRKISRNISPEEIAAETRIITFLTETAESFADPKAASKAAKTLEKELDKRLDSIDNKAKETGEKLNNVFLFCEETLKSEEMLILVTELTINKNSVEFMKSYKCQKYIEHCAALHLFERNQKLAAELKGIIG